MAENQPETPLIDPSVIKPKSTAKAPKKSASAKKPADKGKFAWGTGRRKSSVARVRIRPGDGVLLVNKKEVDDYFRHQQDRNAVRSPLKALKMENVFDVYVNVKGGGTTGQAGATMLGIARALRNFDENFLKDRRDGGYLTRDDRMVERKKPGKAGARKRFQFSKR